MNQAAQHPAPRRLAFARRQRLSGRRAFAAVYGAKMRKNIGPLGVWSRPNGLGHARLGLSVSRRVGPAVLRNRVKRLLREAFRLTQHDWPASYDAVIVVHPHPTRELAQYVALLRQAMVQVHTAWSRRGPSCSAG